MGTRLPITTDNTPPPAGRVYRMRSGSGRTWQVGPTSSDGSPVTLDHARQIASELGFELVEDSDAPDAWRASCEACGWSHPAPTYAAAGEAAREHGDTCPDASTVVEAVTS